MLQKCAFPLLFRENSLQAGSWEEHIPEVRRFRQRLTGKALHGSSQISQYDRIHRAPHAEMHTCNRPELSEEGWPAKGENEGGVRAAMPGSKGKQSRA